MADDKDLEKQQQEDKEAQQADSAPEKSGEQKDAVDTQQSSQPVADESPLTEDSAEDKQSSESKAETESKESKAETEAETEAEEPAGKETDPAEQHLGMNYYTDEKKEVEHETDDYLGISVPKEPWTNRMRLFGVVVVVMFFGGFGIWSYFAPIESAAVAPGKVMVAGYRRTIQHLEGGIVQKINIKEGKKVNAGEVLIKLDDTQAKVTLEVARNQVNELLARESRLIAERDNKQAITFPRRLLDQINNPQIANLMNAQKNVFLANRETYLGNVKILQQRIVQLTEQIKGIDAQLKANSEQLGFIEEEVVSTKELEKRKLIERPKLLQLQREAARLQGARGENLAEISVLKQKIGESEAQILTLTSTRLKETLDELRDVQQKLHEETEKERASLDILTRTDILAPQSGRVVGLKKHTIGGVIKPGEDIMDIVPSDDVLVIEARVNPLDIDVVHPGLLARVQLTSLKQRTTPTLEGRVIDVSADIFQDERDKDSYYLARISIDPEELAKLGNQPLTPGMPAQVMIVTEKRTPLQYFIQPIKDSFNRAFREQ